MNIGSLCVCELVLSHFYVLSLPLQGVSGLCLGDLTFKGAVAQYRVHRDQAF